MKIFFSEHNRDYSTYTFSYAVYALMEKPEDFPLIYDMGFLPYSNDLKEFREIFYLARSLRVDTSQFTDSSENRRVDRKLAPLGIRVELKHVQDLDLADPAFRKFCLDYAETRFSGHAMPPERFDYILSRKILTHVLTFSKEDGTTAGYVFCLLAGGMLHYWFSFFDAELMENFPLGKWMMWKTIQWAREREIKHVYLGTCYGERSLYKVRDFKGLRFFDGIEWNKDMELLKKWCRTDHLDLPADRFKLGDDFKAGSDDLMRKV